VSRVEVILPQQQEVTTSPVNINSHGFDIKFQQNSVQYPYPINLKTTSSDINIENISTTNTLIQTTSGDIKGSISSLRDEINIGSTSGDIDVNVSTSTILGLSPRVGLKSTSGDIDLELSVSNVVVRPIVDVSATSGDINTDIKLANGITDSQITINATSGDINLNLVRFFITVLKKKKKKFLLLFTNIIIILFLCSIIHSKDNIKLRPLLVMLMLESEMLKIITDKVELVQ
jgi:hypothetical protein